MATKTPTRTQYVQALPNLGQAAELIGLDPSGVTRAIQQLNISPLAWGSREKHLAVKDVLRIAANAQRASLEEVAGGLLEMAEREHPQQASAITAEIDDFFRGLDEPQANEPDQFVTELRAALPKRWAAKAEEIWRAHLAGHAA